MRTDYSGSESSRELSFPGAKVLSGNFRSEERKYRGAKSPDTNSNSNSTPLTLNRIKPVGLGLVFGSFIFGTFR